MPYKDPDKMRDINGRFVWRGGKHTSYHKMKIRFVNEMLAIEV